MITPLQNMLQQLLKEADTSQQLVSTNTLDPVFSGRSVKKNNIVQTELSNFMLSKADYASISDKKLVERLCQLCDTLPDERFDVRNQETCAKALADIICKNTKKNSNIDSEEFTGDESDESDKGYQSWNEHNESEPNPNKKDKATLTPKHTKACENDLETQEKRHIKLLSKQETDAMLKEVLDTYNLTFSTEHKTLKDFLRALKISHIITQNSLQDIFLPLLTASLEILSLSEDFRGKTTKEILNHLGVINDDIDDDDWQDLKTKIDSKEKIIESQEDLEQVIKEYKLFINDIKLRAELLTGYEDPMVRFSSAGEYSIHSKDPKVRKLVYKNLEEFKEKALKEYKYDINKMRATVEYATYKANMEIVHSESRVSSLLFNMSPFLTNENSHIKYNTRLTYDLIDALKKGVITSEEYSEEINKIKYGNCDHFADSIRKTLEQLKYDKGEYGIVVLKGFGENISHTFNYITVNDKITIVDAWKNVVCDLASMERFYPAYFCENSGYLLRFLG